MCVAHVGFANIIVGCPNLVLIKTQYESPCTRYGHPMVTVLGSTRTNAHCLIMLCAFDERFAINELDLIGITASNMNPYKKYIQGFLFV